MGRDDKDSKGRRGDERGRAGERCGIDVRAQSQTPRHVAEWVQWVMKVQILP